MADSINAFFDRPILNSPYDCPARHWELDEHGQPTLRLIDTRRRAEFITPIFIDTEYNEESFFVRHAYFLGANHPYGALKTSLRAEVDEEAWASLHSDTSRPFPKPRGGRIAVKVINHLGDEVMRVFKVK